MADIRRTSEYRKLLPFIARVSGDVGDATIGEDVQALLQALANHMATTSDDHTQYASAEGSDITRSAKHATKTTAISLISDTQPASPIPGMVWIDTND